NWGGGAKDRKSTSGYVFTYGGAAISWASRKQATVALSTAEAEYISLCSATQEAIYLRRIIAELEGDTSEPTKIWQDNQSTIRIANDYISNRNTKHIEIKFHYTREMIERKEIEVEYLPTAEMPADILTKPVGPTILERMLPTFFGQDVALRRSVRMQAKSHPKTYGMDGEYERYLKLYQEPEEDMGDGKKHEEDNAEEGKMIGTLVDEFHASQHKHDVAEHKNSRFSEKHKPKIGIGEYPKKNYG
ncbi:MAG: Ty1/Copia family ribonuclease HI, partial [Metallibacterium sp.]